MDNSTSSFSLLKCFREYLDILKSTFEEEENRAISSTISLSKKGRRCLASSLYASKYVTYEKKKDVLFERCTEKINSKKGFCPLHTKLNDRLSSVIHIFERMEDMDEFNYILRVLPSKKILEKRIEEWFHSKPVMLWIVYFFLIYEVVIREERNYVCYYFTKDEGHTTAIAIQKNAIEMMGKILSIDYHTSALYSMENIFDVRSVCIYFDTLFLYQKEFSILSLKLSRKYISGCSFHRSQKNRRVICDILSCFLGEEEEKYDNLHKDVEHYSSIEALTHRIAKENELEYLYTPIEECKSSSPNDSIHMDHSEVLCQNIESPPEEEDEIFVSLYEGPKRKKKSSAAPICIDEKFLWDEYNKESLRLISDILHSYYMILQKNIIRLEKLENLFERMEIKNSIHSLKDVFIDKKIAHYQTHKRYLDEYIKQIKINDALKPVMKIALAMRITFEYTFTGPSEKYKKYSMEEIKMLDQYWNMFLEDASNSSCPLPQIISLWCAEEKNEWSFSHFFVAISVHDNIFYFQKDLFTGNKEFLKEMKAITDISFDIKQEARKMGKNLLDIADMEKKFFRTFEVNKTKESLVAYTFK